MKSLIVIFLLILSLLGESLTSRINHLSVDQTYIMNRTYDTAFILASNVHWKGKTSRQVAIYMVATAWIESDFGANLVGKTNDYGVFQITIPTFKRRYFVDKGFPTMSDERLKCLLISNFDLNFDAALDEIKFWHKVYGDNWHKIYGSYNGGYKGNEVYSKSIVKRIQIIEKFMRENR